MLPRRASASDLYACGARVHIPSIKVPNGTNRSVRTPAAAADRNPTPITPSSRRRRRHTVGDVQSSLWCQLGDLGRTLTFSEDVVSSRSPQSVSYRHARNRLRDVFHPTTAVKEERKRRVKFVEPFGDVGRHDCRGEVKRHPLCHLNTPQTTPAPESLQPQRDKPSTGHPARQTVPSSTSHSIPCPSHVPAMPSNMLYHRVRVVPPSKSVPWEERALQQLSSSTAVRLGGGEEVVKEEPPHQVQGLWSAPLEDEEWERTSEERGTPVMQDYVTSLQLGAKPVHQRQAGGGGGGGGGGGRRGGGGGEVGRGREEVIVLDNDTRFEKILQSSYPRQPSEWCERANVEEEEEEEEKGLSHMMGKRYVRGARRWTALPQPAPTPERLQWVCRNEESLPSIAGSLSTASSLDRESSRTQWEFCSIMREWTAKSGIHVHPEDISETSIVHNIHSCNKNSKLLAIASSVRLAERSLRSIGSREAPGGSDGKGEGGGVSQRVISGLSELLADPSTGVQVPAAVTLYTLGRETAKAQSVLLEAVCGGCGLPEEWAGLQCLAVAGVCEGCVVEGLQRHLLTSPDTGHRDRAGHLMARLSDRMSLVHALLAEQLNSRGWQERLTACRLLPSLLCPLSTDVCGKLVLMSWEDWSGPVREAASQALGQTGHARLLHDELHRRLSEGSQVERLDALRKLHSLELMTPQLLSALLPCLTDHHTSIKTEAIAIAGTLKISDGRVIQQLVQLLADSTWKVRAHTLKALSCIGCSDKAVMEQLLWVVQCDKVPAVRAEACHTLALLLRRRSGEGGLRGRRRSQATQLEGEGKAGEEEREEEEERRVVSTLRDRLIVEEDPVVIGELTSALRQLGGRVDQEDPLLSSIQGEVKRLGTGAAITRDILDSDRATVTNYVISRPSAHLTTRDYLSNTHRHRFYSDPAATAGARVVRPTGGGERVWSPDRRTIDTKLEAMRRHCTAPLTINQPHPP